MQNRAFLGAGQRIVLFVFHTTNTLPQAGHLTFLPAKLLGTFRDFWHWEQDTILCSTTTGMIASAWTTSSSIAPVFDGKGRGREVTSRFLSSWPRREVLALRLVRGRSSSESSS